MTSWQQNPGRCEKFRRCGGQALVEFVLLITLLVVVVVQIYTMIGWSRDNINAQAASWFVVRSQTFDFINNNTPQSLVNPLLTQAVFTDHQRLETKLTGDPFSVDGLIDVIHGHLQYGTATAAMLYVYDLISVLSLDVSVIREGEVKVETRDYFEHLPSFLNLARGVTKLESDGHRYFQSSGLSTVYASWTSCAQNHNFDTDHAQNNESSGGDIQRQIEATKEKLETEAKEYDQQASADYQQWEKEKDSQKKAEYWNDYIQAKNEAAKLWREADAMSVPGQKPGSASP
jgi:hypothetical protein